MAERRSVGAASDRDVGAGPPAGRFASGKRLAAPLVHGQPAGGALSAPSLAAISVAPRSSSARSAGPKARGAVGVDVELADDPTVEAHRDDHLGARRGEAGR